MLKKLTPVQSPKVYEIRLDNIKRIYPDAKEFDIIAHYDNLLYRSWLSYEEPILYENALPYLIFLWNMGIKKVSINLFTGGERVSPDYLIDELVFEIDVKNHLK